jgi:hypothetical protein
MAPWSVCFGVRSRKLSNVDQSLDGWPNIYYLELLRASEVTLSYWSRLHLQSLAPAKPHWARVEGYGPFSLCVIHKESLCPSSEDINRLMMKQRWTCLIWYFIISPRHPLCTKMTKLWGILQTWQAVSPSLSNYSLSHLGVLLIL